MSKFTIAFLIVHFGGMIVYMAAIDKYKCQPDQQEIFSQDCYDWKGIAGLWEVVLLQEFVIKPLLP